MAGTCEWPVAWSSCEDCWPAGIDEADRPLYEEMATNLLWEWTERRFGVCVETIRPCRRTCVGGDTFRGRGPHVDGGSPWTPVLVGGEWLNVSCGSCGAGACGCDETAALLLPGPVNAITEVLLDGVALDPAAYRVDDRRWLVRTDGGRWPTCQNMTADTTEEGTWSVTYERGTPVPLNGQVAAARLACELAKSVCGDSSCALPKRVQTVSRQGVTIALLDSFDDVEKGRTGIWLIDSWVASVTMPPKRGGSVYSVDVPRSRERRTTWP